MDPLSLIIAALVSGATSALKSNAEQALKDAYSGLKSLIKKKWADAEVEVIEKEPTSKSRQELLKESLAVGAVQGDADVLAAAVELLRSVEKHDPAAVAAGGLRIDEVHALGNMRIEEILAAPGGTHIGSMRSGADMTLGSLGGSGERRNPPSR